MPPLRNLNRRLAEASNDPRACRHAKPNVAPVPYPLWCFLIKFAKPFCNWNRNRGAPTWKCVICMQDGPASARYLRNVRFLVAMNAQIRQMLVGTKTQFNLLPIRRARSLIIILVPIALYQFNWYDQNILNKKWLFSLLHFKWFMNILFQFIRSIIKLIDFFMKNSKIEENFKFEK